MITLTTKTKIKLATLTYRLIHFSRLCLGLGDHLTVRRKDLNWSLDLNEGIDFSIFLLGSFEPSTLKAMRSCVKPGSTVIDIGANIGAHTVHFAKWVGGSGRVIAIEPTDWAYSKLRTNLNLNPQLSQRVVTHQLMLLSTLKQELPKEVCSSWPLASSHRDSLYAGCHPVHMGKSMTTSRAKVDTLDSLVESQRIEAIDLIKLDVDGFEWEVLQGARKTLERYRPTILMEFEPCLVTPQVFDSMVSFLVSLGYQIDEASSGFYGKLDPTLLREKIPEGSSKNLLLTLKK